MEMISLQLMLGVSGLDSLCEFVFCDCNYNEFVMYKHVCDRVCIKNCSVLTLVNYW
jgi:hypothetical protein